MFFATGAALDRRDAAAGAAARARCSPGSRGGPPAAARARRSASSLASAGRRGAAINRGLVVVGLLLAFGVSLGIFTATYDQQARVDAQLTLGADVVVTAPPGTIARSATSPARSHRVSGRHGDDRARPLLRLRRPRPPGHIRHRPERRSPGPPRCATPTSSAGARRQMLEPPAHDPRRDPRLAGDDHRLLARARDLLKLRVLDQRNRQVPRRPFHVVGTVQEFPSAPRDSFMVTNLELPRARRRTTPGPNVVFAKHERQPGARSRAASPPRPAADGTTVKNIASRPRRPSSSITTVDLTGISRIEEVFAVVLAAARDGALRCGRDRRAASRARHDGGDRRAAAAHRGVRVERGGLVLGAALAPGRRARLAAGTDAGRDAHPRLRPSAGPPRDPLGLPGRHSAGLPPCRCSSPPCWHAACWAACRWARSFASIEESSPGGGILKRCRHHAYWWWRTTPGSAISRRGLREEGFAVRAVARRRRAGRASSSSGRPDHRHRPARRRRARRLPGPSRAGRPLPRSVPDRPGRDHRPPRRASAPEATTTSPSRLTSPSSSRGCRRSCGAAAATASTTVGDLRLDPATHAVSVRRRTVPMTPTEFRLLARTGLAAERDAAAPRARRGPAGPTVRSSTTTRSTSTWPACGGSSASWEAPPSSRTVHGVGYQLQ